MKAKLLSIFSFTFTLAFKMLF